MQEFTVVCTTCQSRIKVRNPNLVGQIVPCPKCSSMVLIENNNRIVLTPSGDAANSQTETKEALGPLPNIKDADKEDSGQTRRRFRADASSPETSTSVSPSPASGLGNAATTTASNSNVSLSNASLSEQANAESVATIDNLVQSDWVSAKAKARRQILLVFFLSLSSCLVAVLLFVLFLRNWGEKPDKTLAENKQITQPTTPEEKAEVQPVAPVDTDDNQSDRGSTPEEANNGVIPTPSNESSEQPKKNVDDSLSGVVTLPEANGIEPNASEPGMNENAGPGEANLGAQPNSNVNEGNANPDANTVVMPQENASEEKSPSENPKATSPPPKDAPAPLPESLRKLATVFDPSLEMRLGETPGSRVQAGFSEPDVAALPIVSSTKLHPPAAAPQDVAKRLSEEIAGIEIQDRPLVEVLELWSQLSGIGTEIRWNEIAAANVEATDVISLRTGRTTYQDLLSGVLTPLGLEFASLDKSLVRIAPSESKVTELLPQSWKISDLITEKSPATEVERIVRELNPSLVGDSFKVSNDEIQWSPAAKPFQKYAVLETLEHLRVMRKIPLASAYKPSLFKRAWPTPDTEAATKIILTQPAVKNVPITQTLSQSAREAGGTLSIDWSGAWEHGLSPYTEDTFLPKGRSLSGLADAIALKFGLEVAWLSSNHLLLTTTPRLNHMEMMVHFELSDQRDLESLKRRLSRFSTLSDQDLPSIRFAIDPQSDMLLAIIRPLRSSEVGQRP